MRVFKMLTLSFFVTGFMTLALVAPQSHAQERQKPKLTQIIVNSETNDPEALEIAQKINPIFFDIAEQDKKNVSYYARFLSLDSSNNNNFIALTAEDTSHFYCTGYGCPYYIYRNNGRNQWALILGVQTNGLYRDLNTPSDFPDNLISVSSDRGQKALSVWAWTGENYKKINK